MIERRKRNDTIFYIYIYRWRWVESFRTKGLKWKCTHFFKGETIFLMYKGIFIYICTVRRIYLYIFKNHGHFKWEMSLFVKNLKELFNNLLFILQSNSKKSTAFEPCDWNTLTFFSGLFRGPWLYIRFVWCWVNL